MQFPINLWARRSTRGRGSNLSKISTRIHRATLAAALALAFAFSPSVMAGPFEDGSAAYEKGDYGTAMTLLRPLAEQGNLGAEEYVGVMYLNGFGVAKNEAEAINWILEAADNGNAEAQTLLGNAFFYGWGVRVDLNRSARWLRRAADQGYAKAQYDLGAYYANGFGVTQDDVEAMKWSILAIAHYAPSEIESRRLAAVNRDQQAEKLSPAEIAEAEKRARKWRPIPFQKTNEDAMRDATLAMQHNDYAKAARLFRPLADQGIAGAQTMLGSMYLVGQGVSRNHNEAMRLFRLAARQGDAGGQDGLGLVYEEGGGAPKDYVRAYMWYALAAASGDPYADMFAQHRDKLAGQMTQDQIAAARALAAKCKASAFKGCD